MQDPLDVFFETGRQLLPPADEQREDPADNPAPMRAIEEAAIASDVELVRTKMKDCIESMASEIPGLLQLAMMMQDPAMVDAASKMVATLSKVSTDLIGIDIRVLQESKKILVPQPAAMSADGSAPSEDFEELTTAQVIKMIKDDRIAREGTKRAGDVVVKPPPFTPEE